jgi:hypothetical protein
MKTKVQDLWKRISFWWWFKMDSGWNLIPFDWKYDVKRFKWKIHDLIWPKQKWLNIPRSWCDKTWLIPHVMFESIIHLVEKEREHQWADCTEEHPNWKEAGDFIKECYQFAKEERPKSAAEIDRIISHGAEGWTLNRLQTMSYDEIYPNLTKLEEELEEKESKYLHGIVKYRQYLWT